MSFAGPNQACYTYGTSLELVVWRTAILHHHIVTLFQKHAVDMAS